MALLADLGDQTYCYLTTVGRRSGRRHTIEIWFALSGSTLYLLSGERDRSDWVRNLIARPAVGVRIADEEFTGHARVVSDPAEDARARELVSGKYQPDYAGDLSEWKTGSLPIAIDLPQVRL
ncbi:MAG: nitroreductase family deazaflavin-dependent oxidoreductase [Kribbellaceae bacterium]|nr:nitroreductase family deazaflavin-dependent oxidoreductase [Kribbellaceae bacterium]